MLYNLLAARTPYINNMCLARAAFEYSDNAVQRQEAS
jgi:hypothetical protein